MIADSLLLIDGSTQQNDGRPPMIVVHQRSALLLI
jgi:hypothetical protein